VIEILSVQADWIFLNACYAVKHAKQTWKYT